MPRARLVFSLACSLPFVALGAAGCGLHFHRPHDAAAADQAQGELKGAQLTDGFAPELAQAGQMLAEELAVARAWAQQGRDRDLLDVFAATAADEHDPDAEMLLHPRCRARFKGDGWPTLCSKLTRRVAELGGLTLPLTPVVAAEPVKPAPGRARRDPPPRPAGPDALTTLLTDLRKQARAWRGPQSDEARLAKAGTDFVLSARASGLSPGTAPLPRCPGPPTAPRVRAVPDVAAEAERVHGLCVDRHRNLRAVQTAVCAGVAGCTGGRLGAQAAEALAIHDALAGYDLELTRRLDIYAAARRACEDAAPAGTGAQLGDGGPMASALGPGGPARCDPAQVKRSFAALAEIPVPPKLDAHAYGVLAREGRTIQLGEQIAALDKLIDRNEQRPARREAPPTALQSTALAEALHATIAGIDRVEDVVESLELAVMTLIRETLRVELAALTTAMGHAERRRRIDLARLTAQLEEYALLIAAHVDLQRLERAGCTQRPILEAQAAEDCRDETTRLLLAHSNAWMLGRAAQAQADVLDLGVRHEASIDRSRAAMAVREVYLAAGVAELAKFNRGGLDPEALAQIIVTAVGFGVVAGGVY